MSTLQWLVLYYLCVAVVVAGLIYFGYGLGYVAGWMRGRKS